jgi:hypothetical protein
MRWDLVFFLKGYPARYRFGDANYFMIGVDADELGRLAKVEEEAEPKTTAFFDPEKPEQFTAFGFRGEADDQQAAIDRALQCLQGFLDGASLLLGHESPRIGPVMIREGDRDDARLCLLMDAQWTYMDSHDETSRAWSEQSAQVFKHLWPFFDVVAAVHDRSVTPLAEQLVYSMKMYRRGATASLDGVEFICKWSALEGLVSVGEYPKRRKIVERLEALFRDRQAEISVLVEKLWKIRNNAVHEARPGQVAEPIQRVDELFLGVAVFAIAHLNRANSLDELWSFAPTFAVPAFAKNTRPGRWRILGGTMPTATSQYGGKVIEAHFAAHARALLSPKESG